MGDSDPRLALVYEEGLRGLDRQATAVDELRGRAATLVTAASIVASFLGADALAKTRSESVWSALGIGAFVLVGLAAVFVLWPRRWVLTFSPGQLLALYVESDEPYDIDDLRQDMASKFDDAYQANETRRRRLTRAIEVACGALVLEVAAWLFAVRGR